MPNGRRITVRELLAHTSGLFDYHDDPRVFAPYLAGHLDYRWAPRALVRLAVAHPPGFPPGREWAYSNTGYVLLGLIVERVTGRPLAAELERRILTPVGLSATRLPASQGLGHPRAHGYLVTPQGLQDVTRSANPWPTGSASRVSRALRAAGRPRRHPARLRGAGAGEPRGWS